MTDLPSCPFIIDEAEVGQRTPLKTRKAVPAARENAVDLESPDLYEHGRHWGTLRRIRHEAPIYWNPEHDGTGFWAVTKYQDAITVLNDPETYSAAVEHGGMRIFNIADVTAGPPVPHLLSMDPPAHTQLRKSLAPVFTDHCGPELELFVRSKARSLIGRIAARGSADLAGEIAAPLVMSVLTRLLDVPEEDGVKLIRWSRTLIGDDDPEYQPSEADRRICVQEIDDYAKALLAERHRNPGNDLASHLALAVAKSESPAAIFSSNFAVLVIAGSETTRHSIANAILAFSCFPEEKNKLLRDMTLLKSAVKEVLRWTSPLLHVRRTATRDVLLGEAQIRKGDKVVVWYVSANRDEGVWANPDDFDIERFARAGTANHVAFGAGSHHCLGWRIAELQLRIALEEILSAFPDIVVVGPIERIRSNFIYGAKRLPVMFSPRT